MLTEGSRVPVRVDACVGTVDVDERAVDESAPTPLELQQARVLESPRGPPELVDDSSECGSSASYCCSAFSCSEDDFEGEDLCWDHFDVLDCCLVDDDESVNPCSPTDAPKSGLSGANDDEGSPRGCRSV